jgi:hypothetical protein
MSNNNEMLKFGDQTDSFEDSLELEQAALLVHKAAQEYYMSTASGGLNHRLIKRHTFYFVSAVLYDPGKLRVDDDTRIQGWRDYMAKIYSEVSDGEEIIFPDIPEEPTISDLRNLYRDVVGNSFQPGRGCDFTKPLEIASAAMNENDGRVKCTITPTH